MDNLEEMDKFLEMYNLLKLNQEEIENMNRLITSNEIESVIKKLPKNISPGPCSFTIEFYQTFKEELTPIFLKLFQKIEEEGTLLSSFYEASITLIPESDKGSQKRKLQANITDEHRCKNPQQNISKLRFNKTLKGSYTMTKWDLTQEHKEGLISANQSM